MKNEKKKSDKPEKFVIKWVTYEEFCGHAGLNSAGRLHISTRPFPTKKEPSSKKKEN